MCFLFFFQMEDFFLWITVPLLAFVLSLSAVTADCTSNEILSAPFFHPSFVTDPLSAIVKCNSPELSSQFQFIKKNCVLIASKYFGDFRLHEANC